MLGLVVVVLGQGGGRYRQCGAIYEDERCNRLGWLGRQSLSQNALVQRFLFYPDGSIDGETPPVLATQHILAELGRVHTASTRCCHAETFLEKALQNLKTKGNKQSCHVNTVRHITDSKSSSFMECLTLDIFVKSIHVITKN